MKGLNKGHQNYEGKLTIKLPNDRLLNDDSSNSKVINFKRTNSLSDLGINRFTSLKFYNPGEAYIDDDFPKAGEKIVIQFPEYL